MAQSKYFFLLAVSASLLLSGCMTKTIANNGKVATTNSTSTAQASDISKNNSSHDLFEAPISTTGWYVVGYMGGPHILDTYVMIYPKHWEIDYIDENCVGWLDEDAARIKRRVVEGKANVANSLLLPQYILTMCKYPQDHDNLQSWIKANYSYQDSSHFEIGILNEYNAALLLEDEHLWLLKTLFVETTNYIYVFRSIVSGNNTLNQTIDSIMDATEFLPPGSK